MTPKDLLNKLKEKGFGPFVEVPCSSLAPLIAEAEKDPEVDVINPASEAVAVGIASGAYLAGEKPVLLIQNSGFLNTLNSLTSLNLIYDIPVLFMISWRGYGKDAPEHEIVGRDMEKYLDAFKVPYGVLDDSNADSAIKAADEYMADSKKPYALMVTPGLLKGECTAPENPAYEIERKDAIETVKKALLKNGYAFVSTNGFISRESFDAADSSDLYMMGSMGHALPIGLGIARYSDKKIAVLDGDGAALMHLGAMPSVKSLDPKNLLHVIFDNEVYASTENQPTLSKDFDLAKMAELSGYENVVKVTKKKELDGAIERLALKEGPSFLLIKVRPGNSKGCKRVSDKMTCSEIKDSFMRGLNGK